MAATGSVRVGKKAGRVKGARDPVAQGFKNINATSTSKNKINDYEAKSLSPMVLGPVNEMELFGRGKLEALNFENYWQYGKIFPDLGHISEEGKVTKAWITFRNKGYAKERADRHPVGTKRKEGGYYRASTSGYYGVKMDYLKSRKRVYVIGYAKLVRKTSAFKELRRQIRAGLNVMILDYDIVGDNPEGYEVTVDFLRDRVNDPSKPFGHGYVLAGLLAGIEPEEYT